ncbi:MAG: hypothetical protein RLZZ330_57 [Actinomycetota bacterium]|jgi:hypothetical protein
MSEQSFTPAPPPVAPQSSGTNGKQMALYSMIAGIVGLVFIPIVGSILGLVFASNAKKAGGLDATDNTYIKVGVITSWIGIAFTIATILLGVLLFAFGTAISWGAFG